MRHLWTIALVVLIVSCTDTDNSYDGFSDWRARNDVWFAQVINTARADIAAKGEASPWRIRRTLLKTYTAEGVDSNYVVMKYLGKTDEPDNDDPEFGTKSPTYTDTVCIAYRGWLMERMDYVYNETELSNVKTVFTQTYFGDFDPGTAGVVESQVSSYTEGFATALQYMKSRERWMIYIPSGLGYGSREVSIVPAYSTLQFEVWMHSWRRSTIPGDM